MSDSECVVCLQVQPLYCAMVTSEWLTNFWWESLNYPIPYTFLYIFRNSLNTSKPNSNKTLTWLYWITQFHTLILSEFSQTTKAPDQPKFFFSTNLVYLFVPAFVIELNSQNLHSTSIPKPVLRFTSTRNEGSEKFNGRAASIDLISEGVKFSQEALQSTAITVHYKNRVCNQSNTTSQRQNLQTSLWRTSTSAQPSHFNNVIELSHQGYLLKCCTAQYQ